MSAPRPLLAALAVAVLAAGCAAGPPPALPGATISADQADRDRYDCGLRAQRAIGYDGSSLHTGSVVGLAVGAAGGAALGAIAGAIVGNPGGGASVGALLGGAVGAPAGGLGKWTVDRNAYDRVYGACLLERGWTGAAEVSGQ